MGGSGKGNNSLWQKVLDPGGYVWDQSGDLPQAPDYTKAAQMQGASTRPNQNTAFGSSRWTMDPTTGQWTQNIGLSEPLNQASDTLQSQIASQAGQTFSGEDARNQAITSYMDQAMSRLRPEWDQRDQATQSRLAAQGLDPSSEAARNQMDSFGRARNDAESSAMSEAIRQGAEASNALFSQYQQTQAQPYNQLGQLKNLTSGFASGTESDPYAAGAAAQYASDMEGYSARQAGKNGKMSGAASGAGAIASMFSDERLKQNIVRHEVEVIPGVPVASWTWKGLDGPRQYGVIAQDLQRVAPKYVSVHPSGYLVVDYSFMEQSHG